MTDAAAARARAIAERRLLSAVARLHRRDPLAADVRVDTLVAAVRESAGGRPAGHRGAGAVPLSDQELRAIVDGLVARGTLHRSGHRVRLPEHVAVLPEAWRERAAALLAVLRAESPTPPRAAAVARRLGLPDAALDHLRRSGELVSFAPGVDYPADVATELMVVARRLADEGTLSVRTLRTATGGTRRTASAIIGALGMAAADDAAEDG